jgi:hypothetical protein
MQCFQPVLDDGLGLTLRRIRFPPGPYPRLTRCEYAADVLARTSLL